MAGRGSDRGFVVGIPPRGGLCRSAGVVLRGRADRHGHARSAAANAGRLGERRFHGVRNHVGDDLCRGAGVRRRIAVAHRRRATQFGRRPLSPAGAQHERRDFTPPPQRRGAIHFAGGRGVARHAGVAPARARPVRPRPCRGPPRLSHRVVGRGPRRRSPQRRIPPAARYAARARRRRFHLGRDALPSARAARQRRRRRTAKSSR